MFGLMMRCCEFVNSKPGKGWTREGTAGFMALTWIASRITSIVTLGILFKRVSDSMQVSKTN